MAIVKVGRLSKWMSGKPGALGGLGSGYGFIHSEGKDIFVHFSAYLPGFTPELHQVLEFELAPSNKEGLPAQACRVRVIKSADKVLAEFGLECLANTEGSK